MRRRALAGCCVAFVPRSGRRNKVMFGLPGRLYTYLSHGIHVAPTSYAGPTDGRRVLIRAAAIETGVGRRPVPARRGWSPDRAGARAGKPLLGEGIAMADNGIDLFDPASPMTVDTRRGALGEAVGSTRRVSARRPIGRGGCGLPADRRCRPTGAAHERRHRAPATDRRAAGARCGPPADARGSMTVGAEISTSWAGAN